MSKEKIQNKLNRLNKRLLEEIDLSEDRRLTIEALTMENRILDGELRKVNAELEKYRIKDTYELAKFIEKEARKIVINKLEKIKKKVQTFISSKDFNLCNHEYANGLCYGLQYELAKILDQVEKEKDDEINND